MVFKLDWPAFACTIVFYALWLTFVRTGRSDKLREADRWKSVESRARCASYFIGANCFRSGSSRICFGYRQLSSYIFATVIRNDGRNVARARILHKLFAPAIQSVEFVPCATRVTSDKYIIVITLIEIRERRGSFSPKIIVQLCKCITVLFFVINLIQSKTLLCIYMFISIILSHAKYYHKLYTWNI